MFLLKDRIRSYNYYLSFLECLTSGLASFDYFCYLTIMKDYVEKHFPFSLTVCVAKHGLFFYFKYMLSMITVKWFPVTVIINQDISEDC